jgi:tripartite-type tricarboxylate transporter receptor subunit TctC
MLRALILALAFPTLAFAQAAVLQYPAKPVRWILGYPPGGGTEFIARNVANTLQGQLGQPIVIENRPGAAAILGAEAAARSAPDGYTLFMADNGTFVFHTAIYRKLPYDPVKDFAPVGMIVKGYMILLSSQFATLKELVEAAKAHPGKLNNASNGSGTAHHLAAELFKQRAGIDVLNVPYKGTAAVMQEVMSGRVAMGFADLSAARGQVSSGKVRALAVASKKRLEQLPDVPTFAELGYPDFEVYFWQGLAVPAGTPRDVVNRLSTELVKTLKTPDVEKRFVDAGMEVSPSTPEEMAKTIRDDQAFWVPLIRKLGITVD